jgi:pimeloyl-ACP methyl ester carboxylesterase
MPHAQSHGAEIFYRTEGSGPTILFAHGLGGNALSWWQQVPHFARSYQTVAFDHRGFARSPVSSDQFQPIHFADDALAILDAVRADRAALVCQSMGGWTGLRLALTRPDRVACLVLCATPGGLETPLVRKAREEIGARVATAGRVQGPLALAPDYPEREPEKTLLYELINELNPGVPPDAVVRLGDPAIQLQPEDLADYRVPTLVIACEHDQLFPPPAIREVAAAIPGAQLHDFPGVGHSSYFEAPDAFNQVVGAFIAKHHR